MLNASLREGCLPASHHTVDVQLRTGPINRSIIIAGKNRFLLYKKCIHLQYTFYYTKEYE